MLRQFFAAFASLAICTSISAADPAVNDKAPTTTATYLITGLHCPPCVKTVESSLTRIPGVRSAKVDWNTKNARIEFDETVAPAQMVAQRIGSTAHMMGGNMHYEGWLALKVPEVKDETVAKKAKEALEKVAGVKSVVVYPQQQSIGIQFDAKAKLTTRELIDALSKVEIKAENY